MTGPFNSLLYVAAGGSLGAITRYSIGHLALRFGLLGQMSAITGTLAANILGCFLMGAALATLELKEHTIPSDELVRLKLFAITGFLGALTTFSTYGADSLYLFKTQSVKATLLYIGGSNLLGLLGLYVAYILTGQLIQSLR